MLIETKEHIDVNYIHILGSSITGFQTVKRNVWVGRCPVCKDSKKHRSKKRFYIYRKKQTFFVYCHNCGLSHTLWKYLELYRPDLFVAYKKETLMDSLTRGRKTRQDSAQGVLDTLSNMSSSHTPQFNLSELKGTVPCDTLGDDHPAIEYLKGRGFTRDMIGRLSYAENFLVPASEIDPEMEGKKSLATPRIVIPFRDRDGNITMIQGRSLDPKDSIKYLSIKTHDDVEKVYGRSDIDYSKTVYCVEGPFDSMFVDNCLATCDGNLAKVEDADVLVWDIQPRNRDVVRYMENAIEEGRKVVIWPFSPDTKMDINDLILKGLSRRQLMQILEENTFHGIKAKLEFMKWKRV